jgi:prepilin-type processing-associated H-X9-DG protein
VILACDKAGNHRRGKNILYADGHVESEGMGGESGGGGMDWD